MKPENIFSALSALRQEGRLRQVQDLRMETASLGVDREGKRYIVFNSNDYLGMTHAKEVQEAAAKAVRFGTGSHLQYRIHGESGSAVCACRKGRCHFQ